MAQSLTVRPAGLYLQPNDLGGVPDGALSQADNVVISRDGILEPRQGKETFATLAASNFLIQAWPLPYTTLNDVAAYYSDAALQPKIGLLNGGSLLPATISGFSDYDLASSHVAQSYHAGLFYVGATRVGRTLYIPIGWGMLKLTGTTLARAGVPPALDMTYTLSAAGTPVAIPTARQVAYRHVWVRNKVPGAPSTRMVVTNASGATRDVTLTVTVPLDGTGSASSKWGVLPGDVLQVYRSTNSGGVAVEPPDELGLVYEMTYASGQTVTFTDVVTDGLLGAGLYTNASLWTPGLPLENGWPPTAAELGYYRNSLFWGNTTENTADLTLYAVGTGAVNVGTTIDFGGRTYTGAAAENLATDAFQVFTAGTLSANLTNTAASLIRCINRGTHAGEEFVYAVSTDETGGLPGHFSVVSKVGYGVSVFCSVAVGLRAVVNDFDDHPGRLHWSPQGVPEALPALNYADVGDKDSPIIRMVPTRDSLFIFKDDGLFRLTGDAPPWTIQPFDPTCKLIAAKTAQSLDNSVFALTTQGVVRVTDTGVTVLSRPIDPAIQAAVLMQSVTGSHAIAYEAGRKYMLWLPLSAADDPTLPAQAFVYDLFTQAWTRRTDVQRCGTVTDTELVVYGGTTTLVSSERRTLTDADYADGTAAIQCDVAFCPRVGSTPAAKHLFQSVGLIFRRLGGTTATLSCSTDLVTTPQTTVFTFSDYGSPPLAPFTVRTYVPREASRGSQLNVKWSQSVNAASFQLQGLALNYRTTSEEAGF